MAAIEQKNIKLSDICEIKIGGTPRRDVGRFWSKGNHPWVSVAELNGDIIKDTREKITDDGVEESNAKLIPSGTVLLSFKLSVGKTAITGIDLYTNEAIAALLPKSNNVYNKYLFYIVPQIAKRATARGSLGQGNLNSKKVGELNIPLPFKDNEPDFATQKKIADRIEGLFSETNNGIHKISSTILDADNILKSKLGEFFNSKSRTGWKTIHLGEICITTSGGTPNRANREYFKGNIPWLKSGELNDNENITESEEFINNEAIENSNAKILEPGTLLMAMYGATVGKLGILGIKAATNQAVCAFLKNENISNDYFYWYLYFYREQLIKDAFGGAQPNVSQALIKKIPVPLPYKNGKPDIVEQGKIVNKIKQIQDYIKKAKEEFSRQQQYFTVLNQSILSYAAVGKMIDSPQPVAEKVKVNIFPIQQAIGVIVQSFERGEMVVAKMLYMAQEVFKAPLGIQFTPQNFGPYDAVVKRAITSGLAQRNQFFIKKRVGGQEVFAPGTKINNLMKYNYASTRQVRNFLNDMSSLLQSAGSPAIERLATVCKIVQDNKTTDETVIKTKMQEWKPGKFNDQDVVRSLNFIKTKGWDKTLTQ